MQNVDIYHNLLLIIHFLMDNSQLFRGQVGANQNFHIETIFFTKEKLRNEFFSLKEDANYQ